MSEGESKSIGQRIEFPKPKGAVGGSDIVVHQTQVEAVPKSMQPEITSSEKQIISEIIRLDFEFDEAVDKLRASLDLIENRGKKPALKPEKLPWHIVVLKKIMAKERNRDKEKEAKSAEDEAYDNVFNYAHIDQLKDQRQKLLSQLSPAVRALIGRNRQKEKQFQDLLMRADNLFKLIIDRSKANDQTEKEAAVKPAAATLPREADGESCVRWEQVGENLKFWGSGDGETPSFSVKDVHLYFTFKGAPGGALRVDLFNRYNSGDRWNVFSTTNSLGSENRSVDVNVNGIYKLDVYFKGDWEIEVESVEKEEKPSGG